MKNYSNQAIKFTIIFVLFSLLLGFFITYLLSRSILKPIFDLNIATKHISDGNFEYKVFSHPEDELGMLGSSFNKMVRKLKELEELKTNFIALVSHELRTPLTSLEEATNLLKEEAIGKLNEKQRRLIDITKIGIVRLDRFINDLLELTRIKAVGFSVKKKIFPLYDLINEKQEIYRLMAKKKNIKFNLITTDTSRSISADKIRLNQVLTNLIENAIKHTPNGGILNVTLQFISSENNRGELLKNLENGEYFFSNKNIFFASVSDNGDGIPENEQEYIFDQFYKAGQRTTRGWGLGLSIAKYIIEAHDGRIWFVSKKGKGSTFYFAIPQ